MQKRWVESAANAATVQQLAQSLAITLPLATLLAKRGVNTFEEAKAFFRPELSQLHDPFLMRDMDKAVERMDKAIHTNEKILIYGDYDVDGTTSIALLYSFLKLRYPHIGYYVPDRHKEGYGISFAGIDFAAAHGFSLIIALDCGIKANDKVEYASAKKIDFIICDHHLPGDAIPQAVAVLDPKRSDCGYPYKELSGCGIGFKLAQAYSIKNNIPFDDLQHFLDLVVVSIASDIVPITGENRVLAFYGLKQINTNPRAGLKSLIEIASGKKELDITDIVFLLGPRINAAGRIDHASEAVELLISKEKEIAEEKSTAIHKRNAERKEFDSNITLEALGMMESEESFRNRRSTVLFNPAWHKGVIGIVASRIIEKYYRPTVILTWSDKVAVGSARSVYGFDLYAAISACSHLLEQYGGHKFAAGLTLKLENIEKFREHFEEIVSATIADESLVEPLHIDTELQLKDINQKFIRILTQFGPFGPGNMKPVFRSSSVFCKYEPVVVGNNHLKFVIGQEDHTSSLDCIGWGMGEYTKKIKKGIPFDVCYSIDENTWNGVTKVQLTIKDLNLNC